MSTAVISLGNVSKVYRMWETPSGRLIAPGLEGLARLARANSTFSQTLTAAAARKYRDFWALRNVSFQVARGECVGIVGRNGSGKSTLLQIIAGTMRSSSGTVTVTGRVAALLELGSGFNPEFTGRENVYLNAAVLGFSRLQTEAKLAEIIAFADIGNFLDHPVKTYSSGMQLRLAFAVQTAVDPEVLIVDEALSVGDEAFARKCMARVEALRQKGTSILLVSHSSNLITTLCDRAILLDSGHVVLDSKPKPVIVRYHRMLFTGQNVGDSESSDDTNIGSTNGSNVEQKVLDSTLSDESYFDPSLVSNTIVEYTPRRVRIIDPHIVNTRGQRVNCLSHGHEYTYQYSAELIEDCFATVFMCGFRSKEGFELGGIKSHPDRTSLDHATAPAVVEVKFRFRCTFLPETYFLNAGVMGMLDGEYTYLHRLVDFVAFRVLPVNGMRAAGLIAFGNDAEVTVRSQTAPRA